MIMMGDGFDDDAVGRMTVNRREGNSKSCEN